MDEPNDYPMPSEKEASFGYLISELDTAQRLTSPIPKSEVWLTNNETEQIAEQQLTSGSIVLTDDPNVPATPVRIVVTSQHYQLGLETFDGRVLKDGDDVPEVIANEWRHTMRSVSEDVADPARPSILDHVQVTNTARLELTEATKNVIQAFKLTNGRGAEFNIVNSCPEPIEREVLGSVLESIREMDELTGGESSRSINTLFLFSETSSSPMTVYSPNTPGANMNVYIRIPLPTTVPVEGVDVLPHIVRMTRRLTFHELTHLVDFKTLLQHSGDSHPFSSLWRRDGDLISPVDTFIGDIPNPTAHGRQNRDEDVGTTGSLLLAESESDPLIDDPVDQTRREAIAKLFQDAHTGVSGPAYIRCDEINLQELMAANGRLMPQLSTKVLVRPVVSVVSSTEKASGVPV